MRTRYQATLITINLLYVALLLFCVVRVWVIRPQPMAQIRAKLESSTTFDDLKRHAQYAMSALEAGDRVVANLREMIMELCGAGIGVVILNGALIFLFSKCGRRNDAKV
jgi:hypothetical protein